MIQFTGFDNKCSVENRLEISKCVSEMNNLLMNYQSGTKMCRSVLVYYII